MIFMDKGVTPRNPFASQLRVARGGYRWVEATRLHLPFLTPCDTPAASYLVPCDPAGGVEVLDAMVDATGMFIEFAELDETPDAIAEFANRYGQLHDATPVAPINMEGATPAPRADAAGEFVPPAGTLLAEWQKAISDARRLVSLWRAVHQGDDQALRRRIKMTGRAITIDLPRESRRIQRMVTPEEDAARRRPAPPPADLPVYRDGVVVAVVPAAHVANRPVVTVGDDYELPGPYTIASKHFTPELFASIHHGDYRGAALVYLQREVTARLRAVVNVELHDQAPGGAAPDLVIVLEPVGVMGVVWLQLARGLDGDYNYVSCPECGRWWDTNTVKVNRSMRIDRATCPGRCRKRRSRRLARDDEEAKSGGR